MLTEIAPHALLVITLGTVAAALWIEKRSAQPVPVRVPPTRRPERPRR